MQRCGPLRGGAEQRTRLNKPERLEWFRDPGFGLFIHWSVDSQLGVEISHSMVGASEDYLQRFITELPRTFNPRKFHAEDLAALAKITGRSACRERQVLRPRLRSATASSRPGRRLSR